MIRLRKLVLPLLALALVLSACGGSSGGAAAATVNGVDLPDDEFVDTLRTLNDNADFAQGLFQVPVHADGETNDDRVDAAFAASVLELDILLAIVDQEFESRDLEITDDDRAEVTANLDPGLVEALEELPSDYMDWYIDWNARVKVLQEDVAAGVEAEEVTDEDVEAFYEENADLFENQVCSQHVLVETEDDANEVLADLDAGADLAEVAAERSIDPSAATNGGDLGCGPADQFVPPFAEAISTGEVGEYLGPVETDFGFHVILVTSRGTTPLEDAADDIRAQLEQQAAQAPAEAFGELFEQLVADAEVTVSSRYGTWDSENGRVTPPEGPEGEAGTLSLG